MTSLGCDMTVDYLWQDVWSMPEFQTNPFDVVVDLVGGGWGPARRSGILKNGWHGGRFLTLVPDNAIFEVGGDAVRCVL